MACPLPFPGGTDCDAIESGECPEWQRELTVNQPPHGFAGSSPASPTNDLVAERLIASQRRVFAKIGKRGGLQKVRAAFRCSHRHRPYLYPHGVNNQSAFGVCLMLPR